MCALALRKWGDKLTLPGIARGDNARLKVVEMRYLSPRQRLVLVRRDNVEHVLLLSGDTAQVVEKNIHAKDEV